MWSIDICERFLELWTLFRVGMWSINICECFQGLWTLFRVGMWSIDICECFLELWTLFRVGMWSIDICECFQGLWTLFRVGMWSIDICECFLELWTLFRVGMWSIDICECFLELWTLAEHVLTLVNPIWICNIQCLWTLFTLLMFLEVTHVQQTLFSKCVYTEIMHYRTTWWFSKCVYTELHAACVQNNVHVSYHRQLHSRNAFANRGSLTTTPLCSESRSVVLIRTLPGALNGLILSVTSLFWRTLRGVYYYRVSLLSRRFMSPCHMTHRGGGVRARAHLWVV